LVAYTSHTNSGLVPESAIASTELIATVADSTDQATDRTTRWFVFTAALVLVSVPVFVQAPLVRFLPWVSLCLTVPLLGIGRYLLHRGSTKLWGDLLLGFGWTWFAGSIYWGWMRWEPFLHLPIEAIGLPFALWGLRRGRGQVGNLFYLGSLLGTAITDGYFYLVDLIPYWRQLMQVEQAVVRLVFQAAIAQISNSWSIFWAAVLVILLLVIGIVPLRSQQLYWWAFSGAVLSTILVDSLFWLAASAA
jgi:hypothetical protein